MNNNPERNLQQGLDAKAALARKNRRTGLIVTGMVLAMIGLSAASIPLYRLYCQVTGYSGTARGNMPEQPEILERQMTVRFNTDTDSGLPWRFTADQPPVKLKIGQEAAISFTAVNTSDKPMAGTALFNVTPPAAAKYFHKTQCFCFDFQMIAPHQTAHFPVVFYIDPELDHESQLDDLESVTLSYTFYRAESPELDKALEDFYNHEK